MSPEQQAAMQQLKRDIDALKAEIDDLWQELSQKKRIMENFVTRFENLEQQMQYSSEMYVGAKEDKQIPSGSDASL